MANRSPPMPLPVGSISPSAAFAAIAASTADPPDFRMSTAICVASGWLVAAIPCVAMTSDRFAGGTSAGRAITLAVTDAAARIGVSIRAVYLTGPQSLQRLASHASGQAGPRARAQPRQSALIRGFFIRD